MSSRITKSLGFWPYFWWKQTMVVKENYTCYLQEFSLYNIYVANGFDESESPLIADLVTTKWQTLPP